MQMKVDIKYRPSYSLGFISLRGGEEVRVEGGSMVSMSNGVNIDTKWGGAKTFFAFEGLIMLHASGQGQLLVSSYGAIHDMELAAGQRYAVDNGHLFSRAQNGRH
jgi:uncharacterized protein (AIM24 family)